MKILLFMSLMRVSGGSQSPPTTKIYYYAGILYRAFKATDPHHFNAAWTAVLPQALGGCGTCFYDPVGVVLPCNKVQADSFCVPLIFRIHSSAGTGCNIK